MRKTKLLSILVLLMTAVSGAWATDPATKLLTLTANDPAKGFVGIVQQNYTKVSTLTTTQMTDGDYMIAGDGANYINNGYFVHTGSDYASLYPTGSDYNWSLMENVAYVMVYGPGTNQYKAVSNGGDITVILKDGNTYKDWLCTQLLWEGGVRCMEVYTMDFGLPEGVTQNTDGTYNVVAGTKLTVEAVPYQHNYFSGWTGTTETAATFNVTVSDAMTLTANFAASPVLTLQTNDATMGTVDIQTVKREALISNLVAAELAGNDPIMPPGLSFYGPQLATGAKEWTNNETEKTDLRIEGNTSHVIFYGKNARYKAEPEVMVASRMMSTKAAPRKKPAGGGVVYLKEGKTYKDRHCTQLLWEGGVTRIEVYAEGYMLPEGVAVVDGAAGTYSVAKGASLNVVATAQPRHHFVSWTKNNVVDATNTTETYALTMGTAAETLKATFAADPTLTLATNDATMGTVGFDFTPHDAELTICDGTTTNNMVPAYAYYFDDLTKVQHIIPASMLSTVAGGSINSLTYYIEGDDDAWESDVDINVYVKEVANSTISALVDKNDDDIVYKGHLSAVKVGSHHEWTVTFNQPFAYNGGNLLVGVENLAKTYNYANIKFYGIEAQGAAFGGVSSNMRQQDFLPKTTIAYTANLPQGVMAGDAEGVYYVKPGTELTVKATPATDYTLASWSNNAAVNADLTNTFTMGNDNMTLTATFTSGTTVDGVTLIDGQGITELDSWKGQSCAVTYVRSFTAGTASTVCLPFAYTKKAADGSFYAFTNIEKEGNDYVATMTEPGLSTLEANTPYLYMPNATGDFSFSGTYTIPAELTAGSTTSGDWTFLGTYETIEWTTAPTGIYGFSAQTVGGISQGQFVKVGAYVRIVPMRCYLKYKGGNEDYAGARTSNGANDEVLPETIKVRLISANGEVTAIGSLSTKTGEVTLDSDAWYSLDGRRVANPVKGVYVKNGRKVVIK